MKTCSSPARRALARAARAVLVTTPLGAAAQPAPPPSSPMPPASSATSPASATQLPAVEIVGRAASGAYHADEAAGAKTDLPLRELPQSVRVITRQAIDDLGATRLNDVLDFVGGVSRQNNFGGLWDNIAIRGLPGNENTGLATLLNGFSANRGFNAPRDLAGVERIEFLKGTASALYGSTEPGGTLNIVTKKPLWRRAHAVEAYVGSEGLKRGALDSTGPLGESVAYRINAAVEERDSFRDQVETGRRVLAGALTWRLGASTVVDYYGEFLRHATPLDRGVVAVNDRLGVVSRETFLGEPADGDITVENRTHQLSLTHDFDEAWRARVALSHRTTSLRGYSTEATALRPDNRTLTRQRRYRDYDSDDAAVQAELIGKLRTAGVDHELLVGFEAYRFGIEQLVQRVNPTPAAPYAIDIFQPVYGQAQPTPTRNIDTDEHQRNAALYVQEALSLAPTWRLVAGLRVDRYRQSLLNRIGNASTSQDPTATTGRVGLSWLPSTHWTLYGNAGRSFRPNTGADAQSQAFAPEKGVAYEVGAKWESTDRRIGATAALFHIRKRNVVTSDPANAGFSVAAGELRSRGAEFDLSGQIAANWRLNASLTWNRVEVVRDNALEIDGRLLGVPRVNASVLAVHERTVLGDQRIGLGAGVAHTGARLGQARTQAEAAAGAAAFELPSYTIAKLVGYWRFSPTLQATLDVDNLFDRTYYSSSFSRVWVTPGTARTVTIGLQAKFR